MIFKIGNHIDVPGIGDSLLLTAVVREVVKKYPQAKIHIYTTGSTVVFENNPHIEKIHYGLTPLLDSGNGHYIERKCRSIGIESPELRCELFFSSKEIEEAQQRIKSLSPNKPTIMFCFSSTCKDRNWTQDNWEKMITVLNEKYNVFQIEQTIHFDRRYDVPIKSPPSLFPAVPGARQELRDLPIRKAFALMAVSRKYLGTNTGFMHAANAIGDDNFVFLNRHAQGGPEWAYPQNNNFYEDEPVEAVVEKIKEEWM